MENDQWTSRYEWQGAAQSCQRSPRCGASRKSDRKPCQRAAMKNGRCCVHGGPSTGAKTPEGLERSRKANWKHGNRSREVIQRRCEAKAAWWALKVLLREVTVKNS
jgi:hypothetical protein